MNNHFQVLSIIESYLGHRTYGELMRDYFSENSDCKVDFHWYNDEKELTTRIINRLLSYNFPNRWIQKQNLDFTRLRVQLGFAYMSKRLTYRKFRQAKYSVLHFHTQPLAFLALDLMQKLPTAITVDFTAVQASTEKTDPNFRWTYAPNYFLEKTVFQAAKKLITFSEATRKSIIEDYKIDQKKVKVVYPGVDLRKITLPSNPQKIAQKPYKILFIGGHFERKGGQDLLEVFLEKFADKAELHLVTQTPIKCDRPQVHIYHDIKAYTPKWLELYHQADLFVLPTYSEPFGWVFIEAMAVGLPIIASRVNAIPEIVSHGETGFLIQPGDRADLANRIQQLIENRNLGREMGAKGRQIVEQKFNAHTNFQTLESIFREISIAKQTHENSPHLSLQF
ncbi:glycosyltransferase family 4 protein [Aerosakkonemataceae cyanobacterium BLCC-F154]|uniref:Glycosyltransferase family 4 protein n=1 Tax=Floridaenema fluviatile BLCC-F154 TaxID=3153640 RepID=A0ABV4YK25_9CYAN